MTDHDDFATEGDIVDVLRQWVSPDGGYVTVASDLVANAAHEIDRLRSLITAWADAYKGANVAIGGFNDDIEAYTDACDALRKAVGR